MVAFVYMTHLIILLPLGVILWDQMSKYVEGKEMNFVWARYKRRLRHAPAFFFLFIYFSSLR